MPNLGGAQIGNLINLAVGAVSRCRQDCGAVHGKQNRRAIQEHDREHVEGVVEQVAVAQ